MEKLPRFIRDYWGKARPQNHDATPDRHPAAYHCLDVAAAGEAILRAKPRLCAHLQRDSSLPEETLRGWLLLLFGLHDVGKFADCFQSLVADKWNAENQAVWTSIGRGPKPLRHGEAGWLLWCEAARAAVQNAAGWSDGERDAFERWLLSVFGHHGRPIPDTIEDGPRLRDIATPKAIADASEFAACLARMFLGDKRLPAPSKFEDHAMDRASWLVAGLAVMADWIGSNQKWFPYTEAGYDLATYWGKARARAERALGEAGLGPVPVSRTYGLHEALNFTSAKATPLQEWAAQVSLPEKGPCLAFLEDLTGSGKTEAALILAHRLMAAGKASGLYWALPTQATANALYKRLSGSYRNLFERGDAIPSLTLAHASTDLQEDYRASIFRESLSEAAGRAEKPYPTEDETASALCAAWLASDRRRSLLADVGVGTIDQALLAALPVKFQSLRLAALADRVLVVDEAHSFDKFTTRLLMQTLSFQAALGGSAIVLSATLTTRTKQELMQAFAEGAGWSKNCKEYPVLCRATDFPLASLLRGGSGKWAHDLSEARQAASRGTRRDLQIARLDDAGAAVRSLIAHAKAGRCAVWIRNTVQDAIDGAAALAAEAPELAPLLFHARFALADRARIEKGVLELFGKNSTAAERAPKGLGRILVATQVIEQSLDLDFDAMVTDLAPIDLLIQRAGRLHRHERGPRAAPVLEIVAPEPADNAPANWYSALFARAANVYQNPGHLWRTIRLLEDAGQLRLASANPRELLHEVFESEAFPTTLKGAADKAWAQNTSWQALAAAQVLDWRKGYILDCGWESDADKPTRLGEPTRTVRLAKWDGRVLTPWADGEGDEARAWRLSEIQLRAAKAEARGAYPPDIEKAAAAIENRSAGRAGTALLLPLIADGTFWTGHLKAVTGGSITAVYESLRGFQFLG